MQQDMQLYPEAQKSNLSLRSMKQRVGQKVFGTCVHFCILTTLQISLHRYATFCLWLWIITQHLCHIPIHSHFVWFHLTDMSITLLNEHYCHYDNIRSLPAWFWPNFRHNKLFDQNFVFQADSSCPSHSWAINNRPCPQQRSPNLDDLWLWRLLPWEALDSKKHEHSWKIW